MFRVTFFYRAIGPRSETFPMAFQLKLGAALAVALLATACGKKEEAPAPAAAPAPAPVAAKPVIEVLHYWTSGGEAASAAELKKMLEDHNRWTGSKRARELLDNWATSRGKFVKVFPTEYKRALGEMFAAAGKGKEKTTA